MTLTELLPPKSANVHRLVFIRHGETDFNKNKLIQGRSIDASLNETGRQQALMVSEFLSDVPFGTVITSSLKRTKETILPFDFNSEVNVIHDDRLDEMNFGICEGREYSLIEEILSDIQASWQSGSTDIQIPEGESPNQVKNRAKEAVEDYQTKSEYVLFSIHGRLLRILATTLKGMDLSQMHLVSHTNACVFVFDFNGSDYELKLENYTHHLEKENAL